MQVEGNAPMWMCNTLDLASSALTLKLGPLTHQQLPPLLLCQREGMSVFLTWPQ